MIIGEDGKLWLVDLGYSGYYPPWFEYAAMDSAAWHDKNQLNKDYKYWDMVIPFVCGRYSEEARRMAAIEWTFQYRTR
jgi:thiamine kinase-like enzyme